MRTYLPVLAAFAASFTAPVSAEIMTNETVLSLMRAGLGDDLVIAKIGTEPCSYDVTTNGILSLKGAGVSERVIAAMVTRCATANAVKGIAGDDSSTDPLVRHSPGIYVVEGWRSPSGLRPIGASTSSGIKTSGNGSIVFPLIAKMVLPGSASRVAVRTSSPTFYFYFNPNDQAVSDFGQKHSTAAQSPDGFTLVQFKQKGDTRELEMGRASAFGGSIVSIRKGLTLKSSVPFTSTSKAPGIYQVSTGALQPGQYAFVFTGGDDSSRVYDFTVTSN